MVLWKQIKNNNLRGFIYTLFVTSFPLKNREDYQTKQLSKKFLQFTKVFAIYLIFKNSTM